MHDSVRIPKLDNFSGREQAISFASLPFPSTDFVFSTPETGQRDPRHETAPVVEAISRQFQQSHELHGPAGERTASGHADYVKQRAVGCGIRIHKLIEARRYTVGHCADDRPGSFGRGNVIRSPH